MEQFYYHNKTAPYRDDHDILEHQMLPSAGDIFGQDAWFFQQDNDPKHTVRCTKRFMKEHHAHDVVPVLDWPSQSPDSNPIENLWSVLDQKVKDRRPQNEQELFRVLEQAWNSLDENFFVEQLLPKTEFFETLRVTETESFELSVV